MIPASSTGNIIPLPSSAAVYMAKNNEAVVNFSEWRSAVSNSNFIYPSIVQVVPQTTFKSHVAIKYSDYTCKSSKRFLDLTKLVYLEEIAKECNKQGLTFIVISLSLLVKKDYTMNLAVDMRTANHAIQMYFHRETNIHTWNVTICDPNWNPSYKSSTTTTTHEINDVHKEQLYKIGLDFLAYFSIGKIVHDRNIKLHRCLNVNICVPLVGKGICFTGLCSALIASQKFADLYPKEKANNGNQLMLLIRSATMVARRYASNFVKAYHSQPPDFEKISNILKYSTHFESPRESVSPERYEVLPKLGGVLKRPLEIFSSEMKSKKLRRENTRVTKDTKDKLRQEIDIMQKKLNGLKNKSDFQTRLDAILRTVD
jgi:hypothetical protein